MVQGAGCGGVGVGCWGVGVYMCACVCILYTNVIITHLSTYHPPCLPPPLLALLPSCRPVQKCSTVLVVVRLSPLILECVGSVGRTSSSAISVGKQTEHDH